MEPSSSSPKKLKFVPKIPPRRRLVKGPRTVKRDDDQDTAETERLLKNLLTEKGQRQKNRSTSDESSVRVAFGGGAPTRYPSPLRTNIASSAAANDKKPICSDGSDEDVKLSEDSTMEEASESSSEETYVEPWNYKSGNYPVVLPLRKPYSGDPESLNHAEFREPVTAGAAELKVRNKKTNHAKQHHLLDSSEEPKLLFFQLPPFVPLAKQQVTGINKGKEVIHISDSHDDRKGKGIATTTTADRKGKGIATTTTTAPVPNAAAAAAASKPHPQGSQGPATWKDLPSGHVGKLLVYKSGKVKLKLGETLYDVHPGSEGDACEDVVAVNPKSHQFCRLGKVDRHAVVMPDVESILKDM